MYFKQCMRETERERERERERYHGNSSKATTPNTSGDRPAARCGSLAFARGGTGATCCKAQDPSTRRNEIYKPALLRPSKQAAGSASAAFASCCSGSPAATTLTQQDLQTRAVLVALPSKTAAAAARTVRPQEMAAWESATTK